MSANNLLDFVVGVAYFVIGFVVLLQFLQYRYLSQLDIVKSLWLLGLFGLLQGTSAWINFLTAAAGPGPPWSVSLDIIQVVVGAASYAFFYFYGIQLLTATSRRYVRWWPTGVFLLGLWVAIFGAAGLYYPDRAIWLGTSQAWANYLLALPGSLLLALAFSTQIRQFKGLGLPFLTHNLYGAITSLSIFAALTFLRLPYAPMAPFFLSPTPGTGVAADTVLQVLAAGCGLILSYFILRIMQIFDLENCRKLQEAKREQAVLAERLRISRDLHDGVIQSLYGIGLGLEHCAAELDPQSPAVRQIGQALNGLEKTVEQIRRYIMDLSMPELDRLTFGHRLQSLCQEFSRQSQLPVNFRLADEQAVEVDPAVTHELYHILQECLVNITRHAQATQAEVYIEVSPAAITCEIADNGVGMPRASSPTGSGLKNIRTRVRNLGGQVDWSSKPQEGTRVWITLPINGGASDAQAVNSR